MTFSTPWVINDHRGSVRTTLVPYPTGGRGGGAEAVLSSPEASKNICHTNLKKRLTNVCKFFEQLMNSYSLPLYCAYAR